MNEHEINSTVAKVLIKMHLRKQHEHSKFKHCPLCSGDTFKIKVTSTPKINPHIIEGEIYDVIKVTYSPASFQFKESVMYKIRLKDNRIANFNPQWFEIVTD